MTTTPQEGSATVDGETAAIVARYQRREGRKRASHPELDEAYRQEKTAALLGLLARHGFRDLDRLKLLEIGCGRGDNLRDLIAAGFAPSNLTGNELLAPFADTARKALPPEVMIHEGNALETPFADGAFDLVYQSVVFTSILDRGYRQKLADQMWRLVRPGGAVLWYDFLYDNPRNPDVRKVTRTELATLFPAAKAIGRRVTLAPPIARRAMAWHPALYRGLSRLPILRTHWVALLQKPGGDDGETASAR